MIYKVRIYIGLEPCYWQKAGFKNLTYEPPWQVHKQPVISELVVFVLLYFVLVKFMQIVINIYIQHSKSNNYTKFECTL